MLLDFDDLRGYRGYVVSNVKYCKQSAAAFAGAFAGAFAMRD